MTIILDIAGAPVPDIDLDYNLTEMSIEPVGDFLNQKLTSRNLLISHI
jgi:hypothetical protein